MILINLLPEEYRQRRRTPLKALAVIGAAVAINASLGAYWAWIAFGEAAEVRSELAVLQDTKAGLDPQVAYHHDLEAESTIFKSREATLDEITMKRVSWTEKTDQVTDLINAGGDGDKYQIWHSSQTGPQQLNFVGYESEEVDGLIEAIRVEYDRDQQRELAHQLHRVVAADQPYTFLYAARATQVLDKKIVMVERDASGAERFTPLRPTPTDQLMYYFRKWRKLDHVPDF